MITSYLSAALRQAHYELLPDGEGVYGSIPSLPGVWAQGESLEACREELREVLEEWIVLGLQRGDDLPTVEGVALRKAKAA